MVSCSSSSRRSNQQLPLVRGVVVAAIIVASKTAAVSFATEASSSSSAAARNLAIGDFDVLNELYKDMKLELPPTSFTKDVLGSDLVIDLTQLTCYNLNIGDIVVDWQADETADNNGMSSLLAQTSVVDMDIDCDMSFEYSYLFFNGEGTATLKTENNQVNVDMSIDVDNTSTPPGATADISNCQSEVFVESLVFDGGGSLMSAVANQLEDTLKEVVAEEMESTLCTEFSNLDEALSKALDDAIKSIYDMVPANDVVSGNDPLQAESSLKVPADAQLLNFQYPSSSSQMETMIVDAILTQVPALLGPNSQTGELGVNELIRNSGLLDPQEGYGLTIDTSQFAGLIGGGDGDTGNDSSSLSMQQIDNLLGSFSVEITSAKLYGLDSFTEIADPITAIGNYTLGTDFALDELTLQLGIRLTVEAPTAEDDNTDNTSEAPAQTYTEDIVLEWSLTDISGSLAVMLALDMNALGSIPLGAILTAPNDISTFATCLMSTVLYDVELAQLSIDSLQVQSPKIVSGFESSPGLKRILTEAVDNIFDAFQPLLEEVLPSMMGQMAKDVVSNSLDGMLSSDEATAADCQAIAEPLSSLPDDNAFVDFRDLLLPSANATEYGGSGTEPYGTVALLAKDWINQKFLSIDQETGLAPGVSNLIASFTESQSGVPGMIDLGTLVDYNGKIDIGGLQADIGLVVSETSIENLESVGSPLFLLEPVDQEAYLLNNTATVGIPPAPVRFSSKVMFEIASEEGEIRNEMNISLDLHSISVVATLFMQMLETNLMNFPLEDIFNINCWLATIPAPTLNEQGLRVPESNVTLSVADVAVSIARMNFTVDCFDCSGPKFQELDTMFDNPQTDENARESAESVISTLLSLASGENSFLQTEIDRMLVDAPKMCPHRPEYDPSFDGRTQYVIEPPEESKDDSTIFLVALIVAMACVAVGAILITCAMKFIVRRRNRKWLLSLPKEQLIAVYQNQQLQDEHEKSLNAVSPSMITAKRLPCFVRWFVPFVLILNIGLFLSGHLSLGGEVHIYLSIGGEMIVFDDFYTFSIAQSGVELWNAGARELAILMLLFAGVWPYTKQLITLVLWCLPTRFVTLSKRGSVFLWLDFLAKWSMIDVFVMFITLAAFRITIESPDKPFLPDSLYQVDLLVAPKWGLYANALAQVLSQLTSHVVIHYHRVLVAEAEQCIATANNDDKALVLCEVPSCEGEESRNPDKEQLNDVELDCEQPAVASDAPPRERVSSPDAEEQPEALNRHAFSRPHRGESEKLWVRAFVNPGVIVLSLALVVLVLVGCIFPSLSYDYQGLVGVAMESGMNFKQAYKEYSVVTLAKMMVDQARFLATPKDLIGLTSLSILLVMTTMIVPIALSLLLFAEWFLPLRRIIGNRFRVAVEILQAWQYMEVFLLALIVGAWQIGDVSGFMVGSACDGLENTFNNLVYYGIIRPEDAKCFRVQAAVEPASYVLISAAVLLLLLSSFVSRAALQRSRDLEEPTTGASEVTKTQITMRYEEGEEDSEEDDTPPINKIHPVPVMFTDQFRWLLTAK